MRLQPVSKSLRWNDFEIRISGRTRFGFRLTAVMLMHLLYLTDTIYFEGFSEIGIRKDCELRFILTIYTSYDMVQYYKCNVLCRDSLHHAIISDTDLPMSVKILNFCQFLRSIGPNFEFSFIWYDFKTRDRSPVPCAHERQKYRFETKYYYGSSLKASFQCIQID